MNIEKSIEICEKYEFYKNLLTKKQQNIFENYYFLDIGLTEIAQNEGVTKQTVLDTLKKTEKNLVELDEKLKLTKIYSKQKNLVEEIKKNNNLKILDNIINVWES